MIFWLSVAWAQAPYVQVLGVAQDGGHPQIGCKADHCAPGVEGHKVASLAIVDPENGRWIIDATPDFPEQVGTERLDGVLLTHAHIGHYTGLMYLGREAMGAQRVKVWAMPRMQTFLKSNGPWSQLVALNNIDLEPLRNNAPAKLGPRISVEAFRVPHRDEFSETVGFRIQGPSATVIWLPDVDKWDKLSPELPALLLEADVAYLDGTFFSGDELPGRDLSKIPHPFVVETLQLLSAQSDTTRAKVRFVHLNHSNPLFDLDSDAYKRVHAHHMRVAVEGEQVPL